MKLYYYVNTNAHSLKKEIIHSLLQLNFPKCCLYRNYYFSLLNNLAKLQKIHLVKKKKQKINLQNHQFFEIFHHKNFNLIDNGNFGNIDH